MTGTQQKVDAFFARYAAALLARDSTAMAALYAVPALILFPGRTIAVGDRAETKAFFDSAWSQYEGVHDVDRYVSILAEAPGSVWADVEWSWQEQPRERFVYQLVEGTAGYEIAVLTPMRLED
jgi:ketosteroid isomerase-like protein